VLTRFSIPPSWNGQHVEGKKTVNAYDLTGCDGAEDGVLSVYDSDVFVSDTVFVDNVSGYSGGGAATLMGSGDHVFANCVFYNNRSSADEGYAGSLVGGATLDHCIVLNHEVGSYMGGLRGSFVIHDSIVFKEVTYGNLVGDRSIFVGANVGGDSAVIDIADSVIGSGFACWGGGSAYLSNLTSMGVSSQTGCETEVTGSVVVGGCYGDVAASHSYVEGGYPGEGNISTDPMFVGYPGTTGAWSDLYFDEAIFQTEMTDDTASWEPGALVGLLLNLNEIGLWTVIADNSDTVIWVWGNLTWHAVAGDSYEIIDLHLQPGSPAIDSGYGLNPTDADVEGNPRYDDPSSPNAYDCGSDTDCLEYADMGAYEYQP
jgi:hypothetical protein